MDLVHCDGSDSTIKSQTYCDIPITTLMATPFNMVWGSSISAVVIAYNQYGDSLTSILGNGAIILTNPDAPT